MSFDTFTAKTKRYPFSFRWKNSTLFPINWTTAGERKRENKIATEVKFQSPPKHSISKLIFSGSKSTTYLVVAVSLLACLPSTSISMLLATSQSLLLLLLLLLLPTTGLFFFFFFLSFCLGIPLKAIQTTSARRASRQVSKKSGQRNCSSFSISSCS